jgi:hypothetical protein
MPSECRFRDDGTKAARFYKPDDDDDRMKENDEDVVHAGIVSKSQKIPEFRRFWNSHRLVAQNAILDRQFSPQPCPLDKTRPNLTNRT